MHYFFGITNRILYRGMLNGLSIYLNYGVMPIIYIAR